MVGFEILTDSIDDWEKYTDGLTRLLCVGILL